MRKKKNEKLMIENKSSLSMEEALKFVRAVLKEGKYKQSNSLGSNSTVFEDGVLVVYDPKKTYERFKVYDYIKTVVDD